MEQIDGADVVIVGGGIAGLGVAHALAGHADVLVIERESTLTAHSTGRSAAVFLPGLGGQAFAGLADASYEFLRHPPTDLVDGPLLSERGLLDLTIRGVAPAEQSRANSHEGDVVAVTNAEIGLLAPWVNVSLVDGGFYQQDVADLDVLALHQLFVRGARRAGVRILRTAEAVVGEQVGDRWRITGPQKPVDAATVVNAAGAWGDVVAERFGLRGVGLDPRRRTAFTVPTPGVSHGPLVATSAFDFYAKPEAGEQLLISPADQEPVAAQDIRHDEIDVAMAIDAAQPFLHPQLRSVTSAWAGLRTFAPDEGPVLGIDSDAPNFVWCCGQGGTGIQTAVAAGRVVAAAVLGKEIPDDVTAAGVLMNQIDPGRFDC